MNVERITLDTNILIYAIDADAGKRHDMAIKILERAIQCDCILTLQTLSEFFNAITRKSKLPIKVAAERMYEFMELFPVVTAKQNALKRAVSAVDNYKISFWDAMLWAAARDAGVTILLSEDFQHAQLIDGVRIVNPFVPNDFWNF